VYAEAPYRFEGLGQAQAPGELSSVSTQVGGGLLAISAATGPAAPFVAAAGGVAELVGAVARIFQGCGPSCTEATTIVDQVEPILQQNNQLYFTNPNRTTADQANALSTVQQIFAMIQQQCGAPALGTAGQNCISARLGNGTTTEDGANCAYGQTTENEYPPYASVPYPVGVCWTWVLAYYDPILNDVPPGGVGAATTSAGSTSTVAGIPIGLLLGIGAVIVLLMVIE
jgi:hypothetical protein